MRLNSKREMKRMNLLKYIFVSVLILITNLQTFAQIKISFPSKDSVIITADWYPVADSLPIILLCHQARFSRGEFQGTAEKLNKFGFNCLAVDLRAGGEVNGVANETASYVRRNKLPSSYLAAEQDIIAAMDFLYNKYRKKIILLGSSYSASLALIIANENDHVLGVAAFSPGEYLEPKDYVSKHIEGLNKPVFITSSKEEAPGVTDLVKDVVSMIKIQYIPMSEGDHGSKVLWNEKPYNEEYWLALMSFLNRMKKIEHPE